MKPVVGDPDPHGGIPRLPLEELQKSGWPREVIQLCFRPSDAVKSFAVNPLSGRSEDEIIRFINAVRDATLNPFTDEIVVRKVLREKDPKTLAELVEQCRLAGVPI